MNTTAPSLLMRLRSPGDHEAWSRFVELYTPLILKWTWRAGAGSNAEEIVQDVFAKLAVELPRFEYDPARSFRAWLKTIALRAWSDCVRRRKSVVAASGSADTLNEIPDSSRGADELFEEEEFRTYLVGEVLRIIRSQFSERHWKAFWGLTVQGKSVVEMQGETGLTIPAIHQVKSRVMRLLREELRGHLD